MQLLYIHYVQDNITNQSVFEGDDKIIQFLIAKYTLKGVVIDDEGDVKKMAKYDQETTSFQSNAIQKEVTSLEKLFNLKDIFKGPSNSRKNNSTLNSLR